MNKERRKRLEAVISKLEELQSEVESIAEEEREAYDNLDERGLGETDRATQISENADTLEGLDSDFESILDSIREVIEA